MSNKVELQRKLKEIGYEIGPFASKETLTNVLRLHTTVVETKGIDVAKLNDLDLRRRLTEHNLTVGPVTNHTRSIYQRKLLEILTNENSEGAEDDFEVEEVISKTPPRPTRSSMARGDNNLSSLSPVRPLPSKIQEPRISLTRIDVDESQIRNISSYRNVSQTKPIHSSTSQETVINACSPQRSNPRADIRSSINPSQPLRNPYDFQTDEPVNTRHEHKATPFRTTNISSIESFSNNANRFTKSSEVLPSARVTKPIDDLNEIRSRILTNNNEQKQNSDLSKSLEKDDSTEKQSSQKTSTKSNGSFFYGGITFVVGLIVFVLYLWLEN